MDRFVVGVSYMTMGKLLTEPASGKPTYSAKLELGSLNQIKFTPTTATATADGDNKQVANITAVTGGTVEWNGWGVPHETYAAILGHTQDETSKEIHENMSDIAPYLGIGYIRKLLQGDSSTVWRAYFYTKASAVQPSEDTTTQGTTLSLGKDTVTFNVCEPAGYTYRSIMEFDSEAEAMKWLDAFYSTTSAADVE